MLSRFVCIFVSLSCCLHTAQPKCIYPSCSHNALWQLQPDSCTQVLIFFPAFFFLQCNPLFISLSPCHWVWGENQLAACARTQWIQHERRLPHNLDLFSFICYLSGSAAQGLSIILLCVGCMCRYACVYLCCLSIRPCKHSILHRPPDPFFCVNNNTLANHGQTEWRMLEKDYIQPVTRQSPNPACRQSEAEMERRKRERHGESYPHFSFPPLPIFTTQGPVKLLPTLPCP